MQVCACSPANLVSTCVVICPVYGSAARHPCSSATTSRHGNSVAVPRLISGLNCFINRVQWLEARTPRSAKIAVATAECAPVLADKYPLTSVQNRQR